MKIAYKHWNPQPKTEDLIALAQQIIEEYSAAGYILTLRQLYYQLVARDVIENKERSYKNLSNTMTKARMAGMISWEAIEDRNRSSYRFWSQEDPMDPIRNLPNYIRFDQWARQDAYVEVWVEKEALGNVIAKACNPYLVPYMSCKGYLSASEAWRAGRRFMHKRNEGKECVLIHLGDHDPSGLDMTRDNKERLDIFNELPDGIDVRRIALNMDQVTKFKPPPNPTKVTDSRAKDYMKQFGKTSWELDALKPDYIVNIIQTQIRSLIDQDIWDQINTRELAIEKELAQVGDNWPEIKNLLGFLDQYKRDR